MGIGFPLVRLRFRCYSHTVAGGLPCHPARYTPSPSHTKSGFHLLRYMAKQEALSSIKDDLTPSPSQKPVSTHVQERWLGLASSPAQLLALVCKKSSLRK